MCTMQRHGGQVWKLLNVFNWPQTSPPSVFVWCFRYFLSLWENRYYRYILRHDQYTRYR
jgi:hypothetical protein